MPSLAPFASAALIPDDEGDAANEIEIESGGGSGGGSGRARVTAIPMRRGAVLACRARGGVFVLGVCPPESNAALRVRLRVRADGEGAAVIQHPPPPPPPPPPPRGEDEDARALGRYVPRDARASRWGSGEAAGSGPRSSPAPPPTSFAEHAVPPGRARALAVVVAVAPSDEKRHAVEIAAEEILSAEESEAEGADGGGRGGRPGERGPGAERPTPNDQRPNDARRGAEFGLPGVLPPGASDAEIAETLQRAFAEATARAIAEEEEDGEEEEEEEEEEDVVIVGEGGPSGGPGDAAGAKKAGARAAGRRWAAATAPPPRLATLFAHAVASDSALRLAREAMRRRGACER